MSPSGFEGATPNQPDEDIGLHHRTALRLHP
jgi:hypothetical protein